MRLYVCTGLSEPKMIADTIVLTSRVHAKSRRNEALSCGNIRLYVCLYPILYVMQEFSVNRKSVWKGFDPKMGFKSKVSKGAKIRNRYNQVPHLTQNTNGKVTNS